MPDDVEARSRDDVLDALGSTSGTEPQTRAELRSLEGSAALGTASSRRRDMVASEDRQAVQELVELVSRFGRCRALPDPTESVKGIGPDSTARLLGSIDGGCVHRLQELGSSRPPKFQTCSLLGALSGVRRYLEYHVLRAGASGRSLQIRRRRSRRTVVRSWRHARQSSHTGSPG